MGLLKEMKKIKEPKRKLELLLEVSAVLIGYLYIYVYQNMLHINVELIDLKALIEMPLIAVVVIPLIHYLFVMNDPLQRSPSTRKSIRFFQNEFPSKYLLERCGRCVEDEESCPNYLKPESFTHTRYWFNDIFHGAIEDEDRKTVQATFQKGYICKLTYYLLWILAFFILLAVATMLFHHVFLHLTERFRVNLTSLQILFPLVCLLLIILLKKLNKVDDRAPSGCWQAWREINRMHISWMRSHDDFLVELICHNSGGTKRFQEG